MDKFGPLEKTIGLWYNKNQVARFYFYLVRMAWGAAHKNKSQIKRKQEKAK